MGSGYFPSIRSVDPPHSPLGVKNVKNQENSKKSGKVQGSLRDPKQFFKILWTLNNPFVGHSKGKN